LIWGATAGWGAGALAGLLRSRAPHPGRRGDSRCCARCRSVVWGPGPPDSRPPTPPHTSAAATQLILIQRGRLWACGSSPRGSKAGCSSSLSPCSRARWSRGRWRGGVRCGDLVEVGWMTSQRVRGQRGSLRSCLKPGSPPRIAAQAGPHTLGGLGRTRRARDLSLSRYTADGRYKHWWEKLFRSRQTRASMRRASQECFLPHC
jgi:hypothetical protein